ncbi:MAG: CotH kinase family protein [Bacteroidota bacterium]|nr:CotH kinase family protein [Bacteroidota bacterium]
MIKVSPHIIGFILLLIMTSCYNEQTGIPENLHLSMEKNELLSFNHRTCALDINTRTLRVPINSSEMANFNPLIEFSNEAAVYFNDIELNNHEVNTLGDIELKESYAIRMEFHDSTFYFNLKFTNLPIVQVITPNAIHDEPKTLARMVITNPASDCENEEAWIGIEHRGRTALQFDKKAYGINSLSAADLNAQTTNSFLNLPQQSKWILDAMYIDKSRLRNKICFQIWESMHPDHPELSVHAEFVELYINETHQGIYTLGENITPEKLHLSNLDALMYKAVEWGNGGTTFYEAGDLSTANWYWDGWEQVYPDPKYRINWESLHELRNLVVLADNEQFTEQISQHIDIDNFVDYFIFLNLISAGDNIGKNTFFYRYNGDETLKYLPWDLDTGFGIDWEGNYTLTVIKHSNKLYDRLLSLNPDNFREKCKLRWQALRQDAFETDNILQYFSENFAIITVSDIIDLENQLWNSEIDSKNEQNHIESWTEARLQFLDAYFERM